MAVATYTRFAAYVPASVIAATFVRYRSDSVETGVAPVPTAKSDEDVAVAAYPYDVANEYGAETVTAVPPDSDARKPNCSKVGVEDAAVPPIASIVLLAFCCDVRVCPRTVNENPDGAFVPTASVCAMVSVASPAVLVDEANFAPPVPRVPK